MKRTLAMLFTSALLLVSLAGCGSDNKTNGNNGSSAAEGSASAGDSATNSGQDATNKGGSTGGTSSQDPGQGDSAPSTDAGDNVLTPGDGALDGQAGSSAGGAEATSHARRTTVGDTMFRGASYEQMLRNAKVHDTNGDLRDGENAMTPGVTH